jgi:hypothetical protein
MNPSGRGTRNSQRAGISETLMSFSRRSMTPPRRTPVSPQPSDFILAAPIPETGEDTPDDNPDQTEPLNPDNPDQVDENTNSDQDDDSDQNSLARSLALLAKKIGSLPDTSKPKSAIKPRSPDVFDGTDPNKLETFTFQISMYLAARSGDFPDDESRVTFVLSYLKGTPLDWFQTELNHAISQGGEFPKWFNNFPEFLAELQRLFGPRDPITDAMNALEGLRYKDSTKATRYTVDFNRHARRTGWNEQALARQYYKGLPDRLKDEIARTGKPPGLRELQDLVAILDQRYWER